MKKLNVLLPNLFDSQPFYILKSQSFIELINVLDPYYQLLPSDKKIKTQIHESYYNYCRELFINQMKESADFCPLTADLWTFT